MQPERQPQRIVKRDDSSEEFDVMRIASAIKNVQKAAGLEDDDLADELADVVVDQLQTICEHSMPSIEEVQDAVIQVLQESGNYRLAQMYMRYRDARERERRRRWAEGDAVSVEPHLEIIGRDGRARQWDRSILRQRLLKTHNLPEKLCDDVLHRVEAHLSECDVTELSGHVLMSFVDTAMCQCGAEQSAVQHADLRIDQSYLQECVKDSENGFVLQQRAAQESLHQWSLAGNYPPEVQRLYSSGRLWIDGLNDPLRGSQFITNFSGRQEPWEVLARASAVALEAQKNWRDIGLILPPMILGQIERDSEDLLPSLEALANIAEVYLYCDGRTPLLENWPFQSKNIGLATYEDDFLMQGRLQELGLPMMTGAHLHQQSYRRRVAVRLAINAQGLEDNHNRMDHLAMALVSAVRVRQKQLKSNQDCQGADVRFAIFGLPPNSPSNEYLERQVIQEGLREGLGLSRSANLNYQACEHLARLFE
ncbi:MAG: hypothetical protein HRU15_01145 [Planctomycetes bacterium]|nr:hypothetical protein [Planctomycetota bacterium]